MKKKEYSEIPAKNHRIICAAITLLALILEALPFSAAMLFSTVAEDGSVGSYVETFSYFSLVPFGYGNVGPLLTVILSFVLLVLGLLVIAKPSERLQKLIFWLTVLAFIASIFPLFFGLEYFTLISFLISACFAVQLILYTKPDRDNR